MQPFIKSNKPAQHSPQLDHLEHSPKLISTNHIEESEKFISLARN